MNDEPTSGIGDPAAVDREDRPVLRAGLGIDVVAVALVVVVWAVSRVPGLVGFVLAQRAQSLPVTWGALSSRWDGWWYLELAANGYPSALDLPGRPYYGPWGFFPFWPWTIRATSAVLGGHLGVAAALDTAVYGLLALAAVWCAAHLLGGRRAAVATLLLFAFFPGSLSLTMPYTEGSFVFWTLVVLLFLARSSRVAGTDRSPQGRAALPTWVVALVAVAAFMACGTRSTGLAVLVAVAVDAVLRIARDRRVPWADLVIGASGVVGFVVDLVYAEHRTGDALIWTRAQAQWHQVLDFGHGLLVAFTRTIPQHGPDYRAWTIMLAMTAVLVVALVVAWFSWRRIPLAWWAYTVVMLALTFLWSSVGPRPRLLLALVPVFVAAALTLVRLRRIGWVLVGVATIALAAASVFYGYAVYDVVWHVTA